MFGRYDANKRQDVIPQSWSLYKVLIALAFGFVGFILSFFSIKFSYNLINIKIVWSIVFPMLILMAWGPKYGLLSITFGFTFLYPFFTWPYNGWACLVPMANLYIMFLIQGYGFNRRKQGQAFASNPYFLQGIYSVISILLLLFLYTALFKYNPPFWNPHALAAANPQNVIVITIKTVINEYLWVAVSEVLLLISSVRRFFKLETKPSYRFNSRTILYFMLLGILFAFLIMTNNSYIVKNDSSFDWLIHPNATVLATFGFTAVLCFIEGGVAARFLQRQLESQEAYKQLAKELEQRVIERTEELQSVITELEAFTYTVSHDLKSPLRSIDGYCDFIIEDYGMELDAEAAQMVKNIRSISGDMIELINKLLDYSKTTQKEITKVEVDLQKILEAAFEELKEGHRGREIELRIVKPLPIVWGDVILLKQVVMNILSNSFKFTRERPQAVIQIDVAQLENEYIFSFKDNGIGFDMEYAGKLFGVFQRLHTHSEYEGSGIGLATVRKIMNKHNGRAWIKGKPDEGATIYITLPVNE